MTREVGRALALGFALVVALSACRTTPDQGLGGGGSGSAGLDWTSVWHALPESWDACRDPGGEEEWSAESRPWDGFPGGGLRNLVCHTLSVVSLEEVRLAAPVPVFLSGPHQKGPDLHNRRQFGHYNPAFVRWLEGAVPEDADAIAATQPIYDHFLRPTARTFHQVLQRMEAAPEAVTDALRQYEETLASGTPVEWTGHEDILDERHACDDLVGRYDYDVVPGPALGFWLRRTLDGSRGAFTSALHKLLITYDEAWFRPAQLPPPPPPPMLETTKPTGPVAQTVRVGSGETAWALTHSLGRGWARHIPSGRQVSLWEREDPDDYEDYGMDARLVSVVGPHVTFEVREGGYSEGAAHPFAYHSYRTILLEQPSNLASDSGRPAGVPLKWLFYGENTRCTERGRGSIRKWNTEPVSADRGACDEVAAEDGVLKVLADDPWLKEARADDMASCIFSEGDLVGTSYAFFELAGEQVEVHLGLSHGCEVMRGAFSLVKLRLTPPPSPAPGVPTARTSPLRAQLKDADTRGLLGRHLRPSEAWPADLAMAPEPERSPQPVVLSSRAPERVTDESPERCRELGICHPERARGNHALCQGTPGCQKWGYCQYVVITDGRGSSTGQLKARERAGRLHRGYLDLRKADADLVEHHLLERGQTWIRDREGNRFIPLSEGPKGSGRFGLCVPGGDDCASSQACERYGRCVGTVWSCEWRANEEGSCDVPMGSEGINPCKMFGKCTNRSERCYAMSDADCAGSPLVPGSGSEACNKHGRCVAENRACVAKSAQDCARSEGCRTDGLCCLDGWRGTCFACSPAQCEASSACTSEGRCTWEGRRCAVGQRVAP